MRFESITKVFSDLLYSYLYVREELKITAEVLEGSGNLPDLKSLKQKCREDFPNIKKEIEKFTSKEIKTHLEVNDDVKHLERCIHQIQIPELQEYFLKIKRMIDYSSVDVETLEEMLETNLLWTAYAISCSLSYTMSQGCYLYHDDLISLNLFAIRSGVCVAFEQQQIPLSRLQQEERIFERQVMREEIAHAVGRDLLFHLYDTGRSIYLQCYDLGKDVTDFLKKNPSHLKDYSKRIERIISDYSQYFPLSFTINIIDTIPYSFPPYFKEKRKEWLKLRELIKKSAYLKALLEGLAKFIVKSISAENDPQFKDLYFFKCPWEDAPTPIHASIKFFEECYKQVGNSIFEKVTLSPPTPEEISNPSLYLQRIEKIT
jgi:hypothetical protein